MQTGLLRYFKTNILLIFAHYMLIFRLFAKTLVRMGKGEREREREDNIEGRKQITFHSFRRFVKTTISEVLLL